MAGAVQMRKLQLLLLLLLIAFVAWQQAEGSKIAYKKQIFGKTNHIKEKRYKLRTDGTPQLRNTTTTTTTMGTTTAATTMARSTTTMADTTEAAIQATTQASNSIELHVEATHQLLAVEKPANHSSYTATTIADSAINSIDSMEATRNSALPAVSSSSSNTTSSTTTSTESTPVSTLPSPETVLPQQVPCTCGIFLTSQLRNGPPETPLIHNELDRMYPCNPIGRKQCQTKCLEAIVQHLPNSASIVCGTLGRDCHKERAYLFIKNCQNHWVNTNLQAGREYCCRAGQPYRCPLLG